DGDVANAMVASKIGPIRKFAHRILTGQSNQRAKDEQKVNDLTMVGLHKFFQILTEGREGKVQPGSNLRRLKLMTLRTREPGEPGAPPRGDDPLGVIVPANINAGQNSTVFRAM